METLGVDPERVRQYNAGNIKGGMVLYRMSRDQRVDDNWALLFAQRLAKAENLPLAVIFTLTPSYPLANIRHYRFMLSGLEEVKAKLKRLNIPFCLLTDPDVNTALNRFLAIHKVAAIVSDFDPLRHKRSWIDHINTYRYIAHYEVDAHNIVPCWYASGKQEFGAYTLRPKIRRVLPVFLTDIPAVTRQDIAPDILCEDNSIADCLEKYDFDTSVSGGKNIVSGEDAATTALQQFINERLSGYATNRNNPCIEGQSGLSPYLHFGQLSAQRVAFEITRLPSSPDSDAFLEELIVRRELADNFCYYNPHYDSPKGFPEWAKKEIALHASDIRHYLYDVSQLEKAQTHDPLWNAAQNELVETGKMHGYLRMYWAKKILEWSHSAENAMEYAIYLNDKYALDGRDPNGYAGIAWSIGGVHDRAWFTRPVFGKIRYMSYSGCLKKFNVEEYINKHTPTASRM